MLVATPRPPRRGRGPPAPPSARSPRSRWPPSSARRVGVLQPCGESVEGRERGGAACSELERREAADDRVGVGQRLREVGDGRDAKPVRGRLPSGALRPRRRLRPARATMLSTPELVAARGLVLAGQTNVTCAGPSSAAASRPGVHADVGLRRVAVELPARQHVRARLVLEHRRDRTASRRGAPCRCRSRSPARPGCRARSRPSSSTSNGMSSGDPGPSPEKEDVLRPEEVLRDGRLSLLRLGSDDRRSRPRSAARCPAAAAPSRTAPAAGPPRRPTWYQNATLDIRSSRSPHADLTDPSAWNVQPLCSKSNRSDFWNGIGSSRCQR